MPIAFYHLGLYPRGLTLLVAHFVLKSQGLTMLPDEIQMLVHSRPAGPLVPLVSGHWLAIARGPHFAPAFKFDKKLL